LFQSRTMMPRTVFPWLTDWWRTERQVAGPGGVK